MSDSIIVFAVHPICHIILPPKTIEHTQFCFPPENQGEETNFSIEELSPLAK